MFSLEIIQPIQVRDFGGRIDEETSIKISITTARTELTWYFNLFINCRTAIGTITGLNLAPALMDGATFFTDQSHLANQKRELWLNSF
jgi:hypothetical protein